LRKITREAEQPATIELDDARGDVIQETPIVGNEDRAAFPFREHLFQPGDAVEVEVVGGLVQQQQVWFAREGARQGYALACAARQAGDDGVGRQAQPFQQRTDARGTLPILAFLDLAAYGFEHRGLLIQHGLLLHRGDFQPGDARDIAIVRLAAAVQQPQHGRFSGAIAADEADAFSGLDGEVRAVQQRMMSVGELDTRKGDKRGRGHETKRKGGKDSYCRRKAGPLSRCVL
jgi:hypothetical protein